MLANAIAKSFHTVQMDVTTTFDIYANLEDMDTPDGMFDQLMLGKVLRLLKAFYAIESMA